MITRDLIEKSKVVKTVLLKNSAKFSKIINLNLFKNIYIFDLTKGNRELLLVDFNSVSSLNEYIFKTMELNDCSVGIGKYNEDRVIYQTDLFVSKEEARSLHLGIDIWVKNGTPVFAPLDGQIHSFNDNNSSGDYGPTIILEHNLDNVTFYTLYGHLSLKSIENIYVGKKIKQGQEFATVGESTINGNWPPHVHFEIIVDMLGKEGDFFGVSKPSESNYYLTLCPDPNLILEIKDL